MTVDCCIAHYNKSGQGVGLSSGLRVVLMETLRHPKEYLNDAETNCICCSYDNCDGCSCSAEYAFKGKGFLRDSLKHDKSLPPAIKSDVITQPLQPFCQVLAHIVLHVVDVWCSCKLIPGRSVTPALELAVIHHNGFCIPGHLASKDIPDAALVLLLGTPMVDHNVAEHLQAFTL